MKRILLFSAVLCCAAAPAGAQDAAPDTSRVYELAEVQTVPRPANVTELRAALQAAYPPALLQAGTGGRLMVSFVVGADGAVRDARVLSSTDSLFDAPTLASVAVLRFSPGQRDGAAVATRVEMPIAWQAPPPPRDTAGEGVVAAAPQVVNGERVYSMSGVVAQVEAYELAEVEEEPRLLNSSAISRELRRLYPREARVQRASARVEVRFRVDAEGRPGTFTLTRSSDPRFNDASLEVVRIARFRPARVNGRAVPVWVLLPLHWDPQ